MNPGSGYRYLEADWQFLARLCIRVRFVPGLGNQGGEKEEE